MDSPLITEVLARIDDYIISRGNVPVGVVAICLALSLKSSLTCIRGKIEYRTYRFLCLLLYANHLLFMALGMFYVDLLASLNLTPVERIICYNLYFVIYITGFVSILSLLRIIASRTETLNSYRTRGSI